MLVMEGDGERKQMNGLSSSIDTRMLDAIHLLPLGGGFGFELFVVVVRSCSTVHLCPPCLFSILRTPVHCATRSTLSVCSSLSQSFI